MRAAALALLLALGPVAASCKTAPEEPPAGPASARPPRAPSSSSAAAAPGSGSVPRPSGSMLPPGNIPSAQPPPSLSLSPSASAPTGAVPPVFVELSQRESADPADTEIQAVIYVPAPVPDPVRLRVVLPKGAKASGGVLDELLALRTSGQVVRSFRFRGALPSQAEPFRLELQGQGRASGLHLERRLPMAIVSTFGPPPTLDHASSPPSPPTPPSAPSSPPSPSR